MTPDQIAELLDLYMDDELPSALRTAFEAHLDTSADLKADAKSLHCAVSQLKGTPAERPDSWFVERTLDSLLRENAAQGSPARLLRH